MGEAVSYIAGMFGINTSGLYDSSWVYYLSSYAFILVLAAVGATPLPKKLTEKIKNTKAGNIFFTIASPVFAAVIIILCTAYLVDGSFNPFLYFRF